MKAITLRNIPAQLQAVIERRAEEEGTSFNRTVLRMLEEAVGSKQPPRRHGKLHHDLDSLAGTWTEEEAREFDSALADQRQIDPELWE